MNLLNSMWIALKMYSGLPARPVEWNEKNMRYSLCFVPMVGLVTGLLTFLLWCVCQRLGGVGMLFGCFGTVLPVAVTGGIHMSGFCSTMDAAVSYRTKEKRMEILDAPYVGAAAVIGTACYLLMNAGLLSAVTQTGTVIQIGMVYILAQSLGCMLAVTMRNLGRQGELFWVSDATNKSTTAAVLAFVAIMTGAAGVLLNPLQGMFVILGMALAFFGCIRMVSKNFGGITRKTIGFAIQSMELAGIAMAVIGELLYTR